MNKDRFSICCCCYIIVILILVCNISQCVQGQKKDDDKQNSSDAVLPIVTELVYSRLANFTSLFEGPAGDEFKFCVKNLESDWNGAFNFTNDLDFLSNCVKKTKGDLPQRICTAAELKFYFKGLFEGGATSNYLKPNKNCNLTSWVPGCEPGWACSVGQNQKVNLKDSREMPARTRDCQPCCEGFFCPYGLTCMIPCPLGAYCPLAKLNKTTGVCDPYHYQLPPGKPNHTCGGADLWADVLSGSQLFCSAGSYCPTTTKKIPCSKGHYCRMGSTSEKKCFKLTSCDPNTANQNLHAYGVMLLAALGTLLVIIYNCSDQVLTTREKRQAKSREAAARSARETAQARERWKSAKDVAKKGAMGLQSQLSRTFSRKKSTRSEPMKILGKFGGGGGDNSLPPLGGGASQQSSSSSKAKKKEPSNLTKMMRQLEEDPDNNEGFNLEIGDKNMKKPKGKIMPGRVSAVMGPSGAGKTTFLSALAGKVTGCTMTGLILINGKVESLQSYKKIIGFVPQDDIVHGNLTVEENLWFSARCRLSADMSKPDKVLVVERVIESLGLQAVRDSIVGTVEKRGISGGQRKRVNVGIEMVMEPSLLILDEPTSGLDSASSTLLLKALRREALEGVNICMVVHQPSYSLYKMFDDFILLAKGGITVYHGPVKKVEEYFAGIGIHVPERVNPPDHYIDILEGIVKPNASTGVTHKNLPVRWMLHNNYPVPPDMQQSIDNIASASKDPNGTDPTDGTAEPSLAGELWQDVKYNVEVKRDNIQHSFLKSKDLSNRITPGVFRQYKYYLGRVGKQRLRESRIQVVDFLILLLAGACLGTLAKVSDETFGALGYSYTVIAVSLLCKIAALRSFTLDKLIYWRERASGMSSLAYFLSKDTIDHFSTIIKPLVYLSMFYFFNNPRSSFADNYIVLVCLVYCVTGIAYIFAIFLEPGPAQLWSVLLPVVLTLIANQEKRDEGMKFLSKLCYTKWALEAFVIANAERYSGVWLITRCGSLLKYGYDLRDWVLCLSILVLFGIGSRILAYFCMVTFQKK
ncbi:hypothetical protein AQUCO_08700012v1 [Aquilegia coerulea]|uniref:ABC transporter domain-containing protein n=2 Tax=Aquilegia coerulea TaxID=218851 RepID=A0A2G5C6A4_AQUCA|nr:hypothetical protein AQUCO_08700012v1 [Aquilegia coerulea]